MKIRRGLVIVAVILVEFMSVQQSEGLGVNAEPHQPVITFNQGGGGDQSKFRAKREEISPGQSTNSSNVKPVDKGSSTTSGDIVPKGNAKGTAGGGVTGKTVKEKTLTIPDRTPANFTIAQIKEETLSGEDEDNASKRPGVKGDFDEKAVQRTIIVIGGIAVIVMVYLGIKFVLIKRRKVVKRYGRVEASEMDLLDEVEDDEESEEEEELFDINQRRRS